VGLQYDRLLEVMKCVTVAASVEHSDAGLKVLATDRPDNG